MSSPRPCLASGLLPSVWFFQVLPCVWPTLQAYGTIGVVCCNWLKKVVRFRFERVKKGLAASWRNLILTFRAFNLIGRFVRWSDLIVRSFWCRVGASLNSYLVLATVLCWLPSVWCLPYVYPISLSLTISISKLAYVSGFYWLCALASCSGFVLLASRFGSMPKLSCWLGSHLDAI